MDVRLVAVCLLYALVNVTYLLMAPFYPQMSETRGLSALYVGVAFAAMPGAVVLSTPLMPTLLNHLSKRTLLLLGCGLESAGLTLLAASEPTTGTVFCALGLGSRLLSGAALAIVQVTAFAFAATECAGRTKQVISVLETFAGVSVALGPVLSAPLYGLIGFQPIFYGGAVAFLLVSPLACLLPPRVSDLAPVQSTVGLAAIVTLRVMHTQPVLLDSLAVTYVMLCLGVMEAYVSLRLLELGVSMPMVGVAMSGQPAAYTLSCVFFARFLQRLNLRTIITVGLGLGALGTALCAPPDFLPASPWIIWGGIILIGVGMASSFLPALPHMIDECKRLGFTSSDDSLENALSSVTSASFSLGEMLGPALGRVALVFVSFQTLVQVLGVLGALVTGVYVVASARPLKEVEEQFIDR